jgi:hypothetical protein
LLDKVFSGFKLDGSKPPPLSAGKDFDVAPNVPEMVVKFGSLQLINCTSQDNTQGSIPILQPSFPKGTYWHPYIPPTPMQNPFKGLLEGVTGQMTLRKANRNLYTRMRITTPDGIEYGPKTWHYDEKIGGDRIRVLSDRSTIDLGTKRTWKEVYDSFQTTAPIVFILYSAQIAMRGFYDMYVLYILKDQIDQTGSRSSFLGRSVWWIELFLDVAILEVLIWGMIYV